MDTIPVTKKLIAFGTKQIFLPKFTIALVRTPYLSPYHARFLVPLDFSKYDLRDYLAHAYNVRAFNIRSFVKQMPVRDTQSQPRHWFRPDSKKYMTIEMAEPFVWPENPESFEAWGKEQRAKEIADAVDGAKSDSKGQRRAAGTLREQARMLLEKTRGTQAEGTMKSTAIEGQSTVQAAARSRLELWEQQRTPRQVRTERSGKYAIKA